MTFAAKIAQQQQQRRIPAGMLPAR